MCVPIDNGILVNDISDHLPIFTFITFGDCIEKPDIVQETYKYVRVLNENTIGLLQNHLQLCDWQAVLENTNVNASYDLFLSKYQEVFHQCCPLKRVKVNEVSIKKPWLTKGLINACKKKNSLYKSVLKYRTDQAKMKYKQYKNKLTSILRLAEKHFYCNKLALCKNDTKQTWKILNDITRRKLKTDKRQNEFRSNGKLITDTKLISNKFN